MAFFASGLRSIYARQQAPASQGLWGCGACGRLTRDAARHQCAPCQAETEDVAIERVELHMEACRLLGLCAGTEEQALAPKGHPPIRPEASLHDNE